jgi:hypothetical protein
MESVMAMFQNVSGQIEKNDRNSQVTIVDFLAGSHECQAAVTTILKHFQNTFPSEISDKLLPVRICSPNVTLAIFAMFLRH